jgi:hypothetical protein
MTPQEIFDTVARHLFTQGERAGRRTVFHRTEFSCRYRGPNGTRCAVGIFIPDSAFDQSMEGVGMVGLLVDHGDKLPAWMRHNSELLERLQTAHDLEENWVSTTRMRWELSLAALTFGLDDSILQGLSFNRPEEQSA